MTTSRRRFLVGTIVAPVASAAARALAGSAAQEEYPFTAGVGRAEITPPLGVGILMSSGRRKWEPFESVRLPLWARAVFVRGRAQQAAVVALDLLGVAGTAVGGMERFKKRVAEAAGGKAQPDQIFLASTHTHNGPESCALTDLYRTEAFRSWVGLLEKRIAEAIVQAMRNAEPCRLAAGTGAAPELCVNRRVLTDKGLRNPRRVPPGEKVLAPEGPVDPVVRVAALVGRSGRPVAILVGATAHPVYEMCIKQVSPDYPGEMCRELDRRHAGSTALFLQGAAGNVNPPTVSTGADDARRHGRRLADLADGLLGRLQPVEGDDVALGWKSLALPGKSETGQPTSEPTVVRIGALRIGRAAFAFLPGEPFVEIALGIAASSPCPRVWVVGYAEDYVGYLPTDRAFRNGGYETGAGRWSRVRAGSEAIVRQGAVELLRSLDKTAG